MMKEVMKLLVVSISFACRFSLVPDLDEFFIEVEYEGDVSPERQAVFQAAADRSRHWYT